MRGRIWILAGALAMGLACDDPAQLPDLTVDAVEIDPGTASLVVGDTMRLTALPRTADGQVLGGVAVTWTSETAELAQVTALGMVGRVLATRAGAAVITATVGDKNGRAEIDIVNPAPTTASLEPQTATAGAPGFDLVVRGAGFVPDTRVEWNGAERPTTWVGATEVRAEIPAGDVAEEGSVEVRVVSPAPGGGASEPRTFTIGGAPPPAPGPVASVEIDAESLTLEEGEEAYLAATARDATGTVITGKFVQWTSTNVEVAPVGMLGKVTGIRAGSVWVKARVEGASDSIPVIVTGEYPYDLLFVGLSGSAMGVYGTDLGDPEQAYAPIGLPVGAGGAVPAPDGSRIAYIMTLETGLRALMVAGMDGTGARTLHTTSDISCGSFSWSPDGERLAFSCRIGDDDPDIWVMDAADGGNLVNLTDTQEGRQEQPAWSPQPVNGAYRIAYAQWVSGEPQIWSMKTDGTDPRQITAGMDWQPAWSPDATRIAFQRTGAAIFGDIWLVDAEGGNERHLVGSHLAGPQWAPRWSPDGRLLAFSSTHETYGSGTLVSQIYTVWADNGTKLARRTTDGMDKYGPTWRVR